MCDVTKRPQYSNILVKQFISYHFFYNLVSFGFLKVLLYFILNCSMGVKNNIDLVRENHTIFICLLYDLTCWLALTKKLAEEKNNLWCEAIVNIWTVCIKPSHTRMRVAKSWGKRVFFNSHIQCRLSSSVGQTRESSWGLSRFKVYERTQELLRTTNSVCEFQAKQEQEFEPLSTLVLA